MTRRLKITKWDKYWRFSIIREVESKLYWKKKHRMVYCICSCWNVKTLAIASLRSGLTISCGCYNVEMVIKKNTWNVIHGMAWTRMYKIWSWMKQRCNDWHKNYGWRWITYDKKWEKFEWFYEDMKKWYSKHLTLDRKENNWNYCKSNCRWTTMLEQNRNTRWNTIYKWKCLIEWCEILNLKYKTVCNRRGRWLSVTDSLYNKI